MPRRNLLALASAIVALLVACGSGEKQLSDIVKVEVEAPEKVLLFEPVILRVKVTNTSSKPVELHYSGGLWDFLITRESNGRQVWSWAYDKFIQLPDNMMTLDPGKSIECTTSWNQRGYGPYQATPGIYLVTGFFNGSLATESYIEIASQQRKFTIDLSTATEIQKVEPTNLPCNPRPSWLGGFAQKL